MNDIEISVIVPCYNAEKTLDRCIKSVLEQNFSSWELIIINDGSSDDSLNVCLAYAKKDCRVVVVTQENKGVSSARNHGLVIAKGNYIVFLDADDWLSENSFEESKKILFEKPDILYLGFNKIHSDKVKYYSPINQYIARCDSLQKEFNPYHTRINGVVWGKCYSRTVLNQIYFNENLSICEDSDFNYRVLKKATNLVCVNVCGYNYTYNSNSTIRSYNPDFIEKSLYALKVIGGNIVDDREKESYRTLVCNVLSIMVINNIFHINNKLSYKEKKKLLVNLSTDILVEENAKKVNYLTLSKEQSFIIKCIQRKWYNLLAMLAITYNSLIFR